MPNDGENNKANKQSKERGLCLKGCQGLVGCPVCHASKQTSKYNKNIIKLSKNENNVSQKQKNLNKKKTGVQGNKKMKTKCPSTSQANTSQKLPSSKYPSNCDKLLQKKQNESKLQKAGKHTNQSKENKKEKTEMEIETEVNKEIPIEKDITSGITKKIKRSNNANNGSMVQQRQPALTGDERKLEASPNQMEWELPVDLADPLLVEVLLNIQSEHPAPRQATTETPNIPYHENPSTRKTPNNKQESNPIQKQAEETMPVGGFTLVQENVKTQKHPTDESPTISDDGTIQPTPTLDPGQPEANPQVEQGETELFNLIANIDDNYFNINTV